MHFVLVHGAYHGAWCWDLLRRDLEAGGHSTSAVDLPNEDPQAGAERYADEVLAAVPKTPDGIILVGHSLAGLTLPIVATRARTRMAIYLCALLPVPGLSFDAQLAEFDTGFKPSEAPVDIMCTDDRAVSRAYSSQAAREQLRVEAIEMPGGHSPFLSRSRDLAARLSLLASS